MSVFYDIKQNHSGHVKSELRQRMKNYYHPHLIVVFSTAIKSGLMTSLDEEKLWGRREGKEMGGPGCEPSEGAPSVDGSGAAQRVGDILEQHREQQREEAKREEKRGREANHQTQSLKKLGQGKLF